MEERSWHQLARQAEYALGDDVALNLVGTAVDGVGPGEQEQPLHVGEFVRKARSNSAGHAEHVDRQLAQPAMPVRPVELCDGRLRSWLARTERAQRVVTHDAQSDPRVGQPL